MSELPSDPLSEDDFLEEDQQDSVMMYDNYPENETVTVR
jgi:hypothetical protein